jgi:hypothetical protein
MKEIENQIKELIALREEKKRLYVQPLSKKITALKKLLDQKKRRLKKKKK